MASVSTNKKTGERTLQFVLAGKRRSIWLGKVSKRDAATWKQHVEELVAAKMQSNRAPYDDTSRWVAGLDVSLHRKLSGVGLAESREPSPEAARATLAAFLKGYIKSHGSVKEATKEVYGHTERCLVEFFGPDKALDKINVADAKQWREWLRRPKNEKTPADGGQGLAENTARRRCGIARQFFADAIDGRKIQENPFAKMKNIGVQANRARDYFLSREDAAKVLEACPDAQWRLLFALSRYAGLRCPSEHLGLRWGDVDWERGRMTVHAPKTEHHEGKAERIIPIFPELRPYLEAVYDEAEVGTEFIITRYRDRTANLRTHLERIIRRAGLKPWPKLFQNLRATRETELAETFPMHVVCQWIGNSQAVAAKHYLQVTDDHFTSAVAATEPVHNPMQTIADTTGQIKTDAPAMLAALGKVDTCSAFMPNLTVLGGLEPPIVSL